MLALRLLVDLCEVRGVLDGVATGVTGRDWLASADETLGTGIWHGAGVGCRGGAGVVVVVVLRGINSGVCVELEVVTGLGGERADTGGGLGGLGAGAGSGSGLMTGGTGGGEGGAGGAGGGDGEVGGGL